MITRLDVLDGFDSLKVCTGYNLNGDILDELPGGSSALDRCRPIYETLPGWDRPTAGLSDIGELPKEARAYVERLEKLINCPVDIISTGPHRDQTIMPKSVI